MAQTLHRVRDVDSLRSLALKYFGDHLRWADIAIANNLTEDQILDLAGSGVVSLVIPVDGGDATTTSGSIYFTDLAVKDGGLVFGSNPGLALVTGKDNVIVSLLRALATQVLSLLPHPRYGLDIDDYVAKPYSLIELGLLKVAVQNCIQRDPRVASVSGVTISQKNRQVSIGARGTLIGDGDTFELTAKRTLP